MDCKLEPGYGNAWERGPLPAKQSRRWKVTGLVGALLLTYGLFGHGHLVRWTRQQIGPVPMRPPPAQEAPAGGFDWSNISPGESLIWHRCFDDELDCARLEVPMDWLDPTDPARVVLAVARLRAALPQSDPNYRGPVFFNPGGPGGSGIWSLKDHGRFLQTVVGDNHDIITFDPRGIGASVPRIDCWGSEQLRSFWALDEAPVVDAHPGMLNDVFARSAALSGRCEHHMGGSGILRHISTASHARDMLEVLNRMGHERLRYWGFSYGTVLGGTFAAMYPDRVERLVSDGNVDYREWYLGQHINFLRDSDKVMDAFYHHCYRVGPARCAVYAPTPAAVKKRVDAVLADLRLHPIVVSSDDGGPEIPFIVSYSRVRRLVSAVLYRPYHKFSPFADIVAALEKGNGRPFWDLVEGGTGSPSSPAALCSAETLPVDVPLPGLVEDTDDAFPAIMCADGTPLEDSVEQFAHYAAQLQEISSAVGAVNVLFRVACVGRRTRSVFRFAGPFEAETAFPILFVANMADNVTPLVSARNNSEGFAGSVVLVQNSYGHTTLSAASTCTAKHINAYFQNGTVPAPGSECEPDYLPFDDLDSVPAASHGDDAKLSHAVRQLVERAAGTGSRTPCL